MCREQNSKIEKTKKSYYFDSDKFIRDLVHGYVYLTKFDMDLISTAEFQRLRDIRQLTCQSVYPAARHTRFEHSLGVMELTRQAIQDLNKNGFISESSKNEPIINEQLQFNAALAALLHDVGHCPFSHMGEVEFDPDKVWQRLYNDVNEFPELQNTELPNKFKEKTTNTKEKFGAVHEQLSCIVILEKFKDILSKVAEDNVILEDRSCLRVDYDLIIRCILGIEYDTSTTDQFKNNRAKNIVINLIYSKVFDMDKLDYIMRDSFYTGIGTPRIDTNRLFRNMYLNSENEYKLIFKNRAVPVLQNFIESRDSLYMYVYNHHTAVFSDFMNSYIFRRLDHSRRDFSEFINEFIKEYHNTHESSDKHNVTKLTKDDEVMFDDFGIVSKEYLFSHKAIVDKKRSDSDLIALLNKLHWELGSECKDFSESEEYVNKKKNDILKRLNPSYNSETFHETEALTTKRMKLCTSIFHIKHLIENYQCHKYLKPWWKTISEFENFLTTNFKDDRISSQLRNWISKGDDKSVKSDEFRSQLAKNVIFITKKLIEDPKGKSKLIVALEPGDFFVIQRATRFFDPDTISELDIALKSNEIIGSPKEVKYKSGEFYIKMLTNVIPQRDYYSMYAKNSFYIFSKRLPEDTGTLEERNAHYHQVEQIFIFVAKTLISDGARLFKEHYNGSKNDEQQAHEEMYQRFNSFLFM